MTIQESVLARLVINRSRFRFVLEVSQYAADNFGSTAIYMPLLGSWLEAIDTIA
ncbi:MAG: hypothetical protein O3B95_02290 [Chloroflexi bacterium]|nr:hypothetical protein [Chloroflexota bacterium]